MNVHDAGLDGIPRMAPALSELETLRALLRDALYTLPSGVCAPMPRPPGYDADLRARIVHALAPKPAPLPYRVAGPTGTTVVDADGRTIFAVSAPTEEAQATAEFIARACTTHGSLVSAMGEALDAGAVASPAAMMAWRNLLKWAMGEERT